MAGHLRSAVALFALVAMVLCGCAQRPMKVPGETDIEVSSVTLQGPGGAVLEVDYGPLIERLGMRAATLIMTDRYYSEFRENEDRRRIIAYWQTFGHFDVKVDPVHKVFEQKSDGAARTVALTWTIDEGPRYAVGSVHLLHALPEHEEALRARIPFSVGDTDIDLEEFRRARHDMGDDLRREGYGHANIYSRVWVDPEHKVVHWYYYVDAGPRTTVGTIEVQGNHKVPAGDILERVGLAPGDPYDLATKEKAELDLLETGAFTSAFIRANVDVKFIVPGTAPDTGGELRDDQIDKDGNLVPRELPSELDLIVHVVEAPSQQVRVRAGAELDPYRIDTALGARVWLRNLFGPIHHLVLEGRIGYGWLWRGTTDDPTGLYGEALVRTLHPGTFGRLGDLRLTARFRDELYPGFHLREVTTGPGVRSTLATGLFFDTDLFFRFGQAVDFGPFPDVALDRFDLPADDESYGAEIRSSLVWDRRDNPVEPMEGHLVGLSTTFAPGEVLNTHRYWNLAPEARGFVRLGQPLSLGLKADAEWVLLPGDDGVPLGPRLFGGGAFGMRGFGRHRLSPEAVLCNDLAVPDPVRCFVQPLGGKSLVEGSVELRFLPPLKPYGVVVFTDVGGAGIDENPFEEGVSLASGLGLRLRFWYLPIALDVAYRIVDRNEPQVWDDEPLNVFLRIGEAF
jgi:outer membrane translocation and assembly module TamA